METFPVQIWEMIKWCGIISCIGFWLILIARWAYKFFFENIEPKKEPLKNE